MKRMSFILLAVAICLNAFSNSAVAASYPSILVNCALPYNILFSKGTDLVGPYLEYKPTVKVRFTGKKATLNVYVNGELSTTNSLSRSISTPNSWFKVLVAEKLHQGFESGLQEIKFTVTDSYRQELSWTCEFTISDTDFPVQEISKPSRSGSTTNGNVSKFADCKFKGKYLYGRVQIVNYFPDITVQESLFFADLKVQKVDYFATSCGRWQFVDSFPDFTIQFVNSFPDLRIQYTTFFPGLVN